MNWSKCGWILSDGAVIQVAASASLLFQLLIQELHKWIDGAVLKKEIVVNELDWSGNVQLPLGGPRSPVKMSGRSMGQTTISLMVFLANSRPAMSSQVTGEPLYMISFSIISTIFGSIFFNLSSMKINPIQIRNHENLLSRNRNVCRQLYHS